MIRLALCLLLVTACSTEETKENAKPSPPVEDALFTPDEQTTGPRMWLNAEAAGEQVAVTLWAAELGATFGWSAHVPSDGMNVGGVSIDESVLGGGDAIHIAVARQSDVSFGGSRRSPALGPVVIDEPTKLADIAAVIPAALRLDLDRVIVRRVDGTFIKTAALGGEVTP